MKKDIYRSIRNGEYREAIAMLESIVAEPGIEPISMPEAAAKRFAPYAAKKVEHFLILTLDGAHQPMNLHEVSKGIANKTIVHPREVFRLAILDGATAILMGHNHPSGRVEHSKEDVALFTRLKEAGEIIGIDALDSVVIGVDKATGSFKWESLMAR